MLFEPYTLGNLHLKNRIVMPPLTRARSDAGNVASDLMAEYYCQRASAGLIISEGTQISQQGQGYAWTPGIYTPEQIAGWKKVTDAVHAANGHLFAQLWHVGRISHTSFQPGGGAPVAPSAILADGVKVFIVTGHAERGRNAETAMVQHSMPRELTVPEVRQIVQDFARAAKNAMAAGFDGVEIHGANGYLIEQFIDSGSNHRTDEYGGSVENRLRFLKEVVTAVIGVVGKDRVGVRQAPLTTNGGAMDATPEVTYLEAAKLLNELGVVYIHIAEADWDDAPFMPPSFKEAYRKAYHGTMIYAGKYTMEKAEASLREGWADLIAFGRSFIANPDLPYRLNHHYALNSPDRTKFFGGGFQGYTDYPYYDKHKGVLWAFGGPVRQGECV
jgi:N-ethylmaleimide reductase